MATPAEPREQAQTALVGGEAVAPQLGTQGQP
jgi:hypothetical protein